jgi:hypothetical protein
LQHCSSTEHYAVFPPITGHTVNKTQFLAEVLIEVTSVQPANCSLLPFPLTVRKARTANECKFHVHYGAHNTQILHRQYQLNDASHTNTTSVVNCCDFALAQ